MTAKPKPTFIILVREWFPVISMGSSFVLMFAMLWLNSRYITKETFEQSQVKLEINQGTMERAIAGIQSTLAVMAVEAKITDRLSVSQADHEARIRTMESQRVSIVDLQAEIRRLEQEYLTLDHAERMGPR